MFEINKRPPMYDPEAVQPMRDELLFVGFEELSTPGDVERVLGIETNETILVVINSVCGCAAGSARPGVTESLQHSLIPDRFVTVFAGQDRDAVDHLRNNFLNELPPSSPFIALMKDGQVLFTLPRHHIEGRSSEEVSNILTKIYDEYCRNEGPSISKEEYAKLVHARSCGSKIPLNESR